MNTSIQNRNHMQMELHLKITSVKRATKSAYDEMADRFSALHLCMVVRSKLQKYTMDGTILRRLRELRESGDCPYQVIDQVNGIYQKK